MALLLGCGIALFVLEPGPGPAGGNPRSAAGAGIRPAPSPPVRAEVVTVSAGGRQYRVRLVKVRLDSVRMKLGLAEDRVGSTEALAGIARGNGAVAAITDHR